ncbi:MAG: hypothetical protein BBJ57_02220 [Desulfobacterales bacterium PC51MH44]|nr:MAG: hypothetical protein BBJ57_02220 [Desulfobacterales bacterium PC51MH44]
MEETGTPTLYVTDDTGNYTEYQPPEPPAFRDTLPEDLKVSEHLEGVEDAAGLARYYVDLKSNYLKPPDMADGYEFEMPEGFNVDENAYSEFKNMAFEQGINQKQFSALMGMEAARDASAREMIKNNIENYNTESQKALKAEWGDKYEAKLDSAKRVLSHESFADGKFKQFLNDTRFGDNPEVIRFFSKLSDLISEDAFQKPGTGGQVPGQKLGEDGRPMLKFPSMEDK